MRVNQVIAVALLSTQVVGCAYWQQQSSVVPSDRPATLRLTLESGRRLVLHKAEVSADSSHVLGQLQTTRRDTSVALSDVAVAHTRRPNTLGALGLAILVIGTAAWRLAVAGTP